MLKLEQQQRLALSPQQQQSMQILRMGNDELTEYLKKEALENPMIELEDFNYNRRDSLEARKQEWLSRQDSGVQKHAISYSKNDSAFPFENQAAAASETLEDYLLEQISYLRITPVERAVLEYLTGCLDDNGFLKLDANALAERIKLPAAAVETAIERLKSLDPAGVGTSGVTECLLAQLDEEDTLARALVQDHLLDIAKKKFAELCTRFHVEMDELCEAVRRIQDLNPKPGRHFAMREEVPYISPDVLVVRFEDQFQIMLCDFYYPNLRINEEYVALSKQAGNEAVREYVNEGIQKFKWMRRSIESRNTTLLGIVTEIVNHQKAFFLNPENGLNPLKMKDIAAKLGVHESTVSRGVKDKHLQCPFGIFPLSHFFVTEIVDEKGGQINTDAVRKKLLQLIAEEDKKKPLSDSALCNLLKEAGFSISRRTVAKYRMELNIPASSERF